MASIVVDNRGAESVGGSGAVDSVNGMTGDVVLTKGHLSLGNVDNTSDLNKPISTATQTALNAKLSSANFVHAALTADQTTTLDTPQSITGFSFPIAASEVWSFELNLMIGCNNTGGVKFAMSFPGGGLSFAQIIGSTTGFNTIAASRLSASATLSGVAFCTVNSTGGWARITGTIVAGATPGTVQFQFAAGVAAQTASVFKYSSLNARKVA